MTRRDDGLIDLYDGLDAPRARSYGGNEGNLHLPAFPS